jgi:hypothetical protein
VSPKRRPGAPADLEEVRPSLFFIHNTAAAPTLRGEGEREGDRFRLTGWRREGLLARLRAKGFVVLTLADQIAALPALPPAVPPGPPLTRSLAAGERISYFAMPGPALAPGWQPAPPAPDAPAAVCLREGWVVRRRKGRGPGAYYSVARGGLQPLDEDAALRLGLAQVALDGPSLLSAHSVEGGRLVPEPPLPAEHRALLSRIADRRDGGWLVAPAALPLAAALLARVGLTLQAEEAGAD